jgi:hypothetical protein
MERLLELLVEIKTPLAVAGGGLALALAIFQQILKRRQVAGHTLVMLVRYTFALGLAALLLGFTGYALPLVLPNYATISGVVLDEHGNLVDEAMVSIAGMPEINDQTGTNGNFRILVPTPKRRGSYKVFARKGGMFGSTAVDDHFDDVTIKLAQAEPDARDQKKIAEAEAQRQAAADAETRRQATEAEAQRQTAADAETRRQATEAEAQRQAAADAETRRQASEAEAERQAARAEAQRQAAADAEARRQAAEAEAQRQAARAEAQRQAAADAEARRQAAGASISLVNPGACAVALDITIGDKHFHPLSNPARLRGVSFGDQDYDVSGRIQCPGGAWCYAYGSGSINVEEGSTYSITWVNNLPGKCEVTLSE